VLPAAFGLILLRFEIIDFLFNWRGTGDTRVAGNLMGLYAVGIIATAVKEIADRGFYSMQDSKTPAVFGVIVMVCNIMVALLLIPRFGVYAMPIAYTVAAAAGTSGLLARLYWKTRFIDLRFIGEMGKTAVAILIMAGAVFVLRESIPRGNRLIAAGLPALAGAAVYFAAAYFLRIKAVTERIK
jgi:putative peptidoglycan lipid II flippase